MRLFNLKEYRRTIYSPESAPSMVTLRAKIARGKIPGGCIIDGHYYVDMDEHDRVTHHSAKVLSKLEQLAKNPVLQGLL